DMALAWIFTLPVAAVLSGSLVWGSAGLRTRAEAKAPPRGRSVYRGLKPAATPKSLREGRFQHPLKPIAISACSHRLLTAPVRATQLTAYIFPEPMSASWLEGLSASRKVSITRSSLP